MLSRARLALALALAVAASNSVARAQIEAPAGVSASPPSSIPREDSFESARSLALGLGNRATTSSTAALAGNVANMAMIPVYDLETAFSNVAGERTFGTGGAVVDSRTAKVAAGVMTRGVFGNRARDYSGFDVKLGLAMALGERLSAGIAGRYVKLDANESSASGQPIGPHVKGFTMDAAVRLTLTEGLHLAVLGENLIDRHSALVPQRVGGGVGYSWKRMLDVGFDLLADLSTFESAAVLLGTGVELVLAEKFPLRVGYRGDLGREIHALTAGLAYRDQKVSVAFSMRQEFGAFSETILLLSFIGHVQ
jgi:opacity protein-like surface antigen